MDQVDAPRLDIDQPELADAIGVSRGCISRIENGNTARPVGRLIELSQVSPPGSVYGRRRGRAFLYDLFRGQRERCRINGFQAVLSPIN